MHQALPHDAAGWVRAASWLIKNWFAASSMQIKKLLKWGSSSLIGHLVLLGIPFAVAEFVTGIYLTMFRTH